VAPFTAGIQENKAIIIRFTLTSRKQYSNIYEYQALLVIRFEKSGQLKMEEKLTFADREQFRQWLIKNHDKNKGFWMVFSKAGKTKTLTQDEALEEALCFGWIDGLIKRYDDEKFVKKFSPRRKVSKWSKRNRNFAEKLIKNGKMTEHGLTAIEEAKKNGTWDTPERIKPTDSQVEILVKALDGTEPALSNLRNMTPSVKRTYTGYYLDAKTEEVRTNRLKKLIKRLNLNKKPME
jgi:uncharacterized protein YdeI (YjbR/CyaY-like superfamily)